MVAFLDLLLILAVALIFWLIGFFIGSAEAGFEPHATLVELGETLA
jgi:hypothetical protein